MTTKLQHSEAEKSTHEAWERLLQKLAMEPVNAKWETRDANNKEDVLRLADTLRPPADSAAIQDSESSLKVDAPAPVASFRRRAGKGRKWAAAVAAAVIFGVVLTTPVGNNALAAFLNQFRVQDIATVDESTLEGMFNQLVPGKSADIENTFGQFTSESGNVQGDFTREQAVSKLGYQLLPVNVAGTKESVYVTPSQKITMMLNVDELNKAMQRVGATKLLPESMDDKEIAFSTHESVNYDLGTDQDHWATLTQMQAPEITVDPSVDTEKAVDAVLQLPILPSDLKEKVKRSRILAGSIPMPYVVNKSAETSEITVGGTKVLVTNMKYSSMTNRTAIWIKDGQFFSFEGGSAYESEFDFMNKLKELVEA
ncbi:hypothetical protein UY456_17670 [Paenibacillus polymyxa]|uniref:hypothetical protein n=1 Tax=Paenibacillus polymyxa TaxID=1406 RepID=UPI002AB47C28|nr:hypothetical protein [Paenibacillus polymyxa]MDY8094815.1 hypothetical protein [Paenibacillus polymyxa]